MRTPPRDRLRLLQARVRRRDKRGGNPARRDVRDLLRWMQRSRWREMQRDATTRERGRHGYITRDAHGAGESAMISYAESLDYAHEDERDRCIEHDAELTDAGECRECELADAAETSAGDRADFAEQLAELLRDAPCTCIDTDDGDDAEAIAAAMPALRELLALLRGERVLEQPGTSVALLGLVPVVRT